MYKMAAIITLILISLLSLRTLILHGKLEPAVIQTVSGEHIEANSGRETYSLDFVQSSDRLLYRLNSNFKQGRVDIKLYDDKGKYVDTRGASGNFTSYFGKNGEMFEKGKPFKIEVIETNVIGSYKFEVTQLPPVTITGLSMHFMLFASFITSSLALLILGWWMLRQRREREQTSAHSPA